MVKPLNLKIGKKPSPFWKRALAYLADVFLINLVVVLPFNKHFLKFDEMDFQFILNGNVNKEFFAISFFIMALTLLYFVFLEYKYQQTIGKMLFNIFVESTKGELTLSQALLRNATKPFTLVLAVDVAYMLFKGTNQRLFEVFSGTFVVERGLVLK